MTLYQYCISHRDNPNAEKDQQYEKEIRVYQLSTGLNRIEAINFIIFVMEELK